jgi:hypothetical protein
VAAAVLRGWAQTNLVDDVLSGVTRDQDHALISEITGQRAAEPIACSEAIAILRIDAWRVLLPVPVLGKLPGFQRAGYTLVLQHHTVAIDPLDTPAPVGRPQSTL